MKNKLIQFCMVLCFMFSAPSAVALADSYYASGEDLDFLMESESTFALEEIEYKLRQFVLYRKLEDFLFNINDETMEDDI